jgi:hypothetical protein
LEHGSYAAAIGTGANQSSSKSNSAISTPQPLYDNIEITFARLRGILSSGRIASHWWSIFNLLEK